MKVIWKYEIKVTDIFGLDMPEGAEVLTVQVCKEQPCIWALVDNSKPKEKRVFCIYGTGHIVSAPQTKKYIGTFQQLDGALVWHLFELKGEETCTS